MEIIGYICAILLAGFFALFGLGRVGYGMSDPQGSDEAAKVFFGGCAIVIAALALGVWAIIAIWSAA